MWGKFVTNNEAFLNAKENMNSKYNKNFTNPNQT